MDDQMHGWKRIIFLDTASLHYDTLVQYSMAPIVRDELEETFIFPIDAHLRNQLNDILNDILTPSYKPLFKKYLRRPLGV